MDAQLGRLLDGLQERGLLENSILMVTSDHGELLDQKSPNFSHGVTVFQAESRAICMLRLSGQGASKGRIAGVVSTIDLLPSLLDLLGIPIPSGVEGESIPLDGAPSRVRFGEASQPDHPKSADTGGVNRNNAHYVRDRHHKFIRIPHLERERLFDLSSDPGETKDLLADPTPQHAERARRLGALLTQWRLGSVTLPTRYIRGEKNDTEERLRALGYVE